MPFIVALPKEILLKPSSKAYSFFSATTVHTRPYTVHRTYYGAYRTRTHVAGVNGYACARVNTSALVPLHDNVQKRVYLQVRVLHENVRMCRYTDRHKDR